MNDILGRRAIIYVFPHQLLIPSWLRRSATYVGLKGQVGCVVTGGFFFFPSINVARRNAARGGKKKKSLDTERERARACVCVSHCQCNIQPAPLYDRDFLRHPQLSLRRITNFAVTFAGKLGSGDGIKIGVVLGGLGSGEGVRWRGGKGGVE